MARRSADRPRRVRHQVTGAAAALFVLAGVSLLVWLVSDAPGPLAIGAAIVFAALADAFLAHWAVRRAVVDLRPPDEFPVGEPSLWTARVHGWRRPVTVTPLLFPGATDLLVTSGEPGVVSWPPMHRGLLHFAMVDVKATGPLALVRAGRRQVVRFNAPAHVTPPLREAKIDWPKPRAVAFGMTEGSPLGDDLFRTIRPYQSGDERRRVDWKSSARHGQLMVRESDGTGIVVIRLVVDLGPPGVTAELVASTAAWVACQAIERGWIVEMVTLEASGSVPVIAKLGRTFGSQPQIEPPPVVALPTTIEAVQTTAGVRRRLSVTAHGSPVVPGGWRGRSCSVSPAGVVWS